MDTNPSPRNRSPRMWGRYDAEWHETRSVLLPERFRAGLGDEVAMVCLPCHAIRVLAQNMWEEAVAAQACKDTDADARRLTEFYSRPTFEAFDANGFLFLSAFLRGFAAISLASPLLVYGMGQNVEIWSLPVWEEYAWADGQADLM